VSSNVVESAAPAADLMESMPARRGPTAPRRFNAAAVLSPAFVALAALAVHAFLPNLQPPPPTGVDTAPVWSHPYPVLVEAVLAAALLAATAQGAFLQLRPWVQHHAPLWAGALGVFILWDLVTLKLNWMRLPYFPGPDLVFGRMFEDRAVLFESTWHSLRLLLTGYLIGVCAGLISGVLIGWFPRFRYWGMPALKVVGPIPATALIPLAMTLWANSFYSGAALIGFAVWFPVTMLTASGIANVRLSYLDVARTLGAGRLYLIFRVAVPSALPNIFIGLFMGLGASFLTLIVAEGVGVRAGLGWYLRSQQGSMEYGNMYAALMIMAAFFSTLMTLLFKVRDRVLKWQQGVIRW
jgi:NitT/TauT family transport system permease protein